MAESRSQNGVVDDLTLSDLVTATKPFIKIAEEALSSEEDRLKWKNKEIQLLEEIFKIEVMERLKLLKEFEKLKEWNYRLREERDGLRNKLREKEDNYQKENIEMKRKICELECEKLRAQTDVDIYQCRIKDFEGRLFTGEEEPVN